jgi:DNA-binding CsgD family transcriptional regulator
VGDALHRAVEGIFASAESAVSLEAFRAAMTLQAVAFVGADMAAAHPSLDSPVAQPRAAAVVNLDARAFARFLENRARYFLSAKPLYSRLLETRGPVIDTDCIARRALERIALYEEVLVPAGCSTVMAGSLTFRGASNGMLALARGGRDARFRPCDAQRMGALLPFLGVADAAVAARCALEGSPDLGALGTRERQVARLIATGLQNKEIADVLGTSVYTVRNQSRRIYEKLGISGRTRLAAWLAGKGTA